MNKTMYEVNWHYTNDVFSHCTVTPITVIREGVLPGCTGVSITAKDSEGRKFQGSPDNYYATEEAAWAAVRVELAESVEAHERQLAELQEQLDAQHEYLAKMTTCPECNETTEAAPLSDGGSERKSQRRRHGVRWTAGLGVAVPPAPTFEQGDTK